MEVLGEERGMVALGRFKAGSSTTGGIKGFFLKRYMFGGGKMVVHFEFQLERLNSHNVSSDVTSCDEAMISIDLSYSSESVELSVADLKPEGYKCIT